MVRNHSVTKQLVKSKPLYPVSLFYVQISSPLKQEQVQEFAASTRLLFKAETITGEQISSELWLGGSLLTQQMVKQTT